MKSSPQSFSSSSRQSLVIGEEECALAAVARDLGRSENSPDREEDRQNVPKPQTVNEHIATFTTMREGQRWRWDPDQFGYESAKGHIRFRQSGLNPRHRARQHVDWQSHLCSSIRFSIGTDQTDGHQSVICMTHLSTPELRA
jgi:hypothetical protein